MEVFVVQKIINASLELEKLEKIYYKKKEEKKEKKEMISKNLLDHF